MYIFTKFSLGEVFNNFFAMMTNFDKKN